MKNSIRSKKSEFKLILSILTCIFLLCNPFGITRGLAVSLDYNGYTMSSPLSYTLVDTTPETFVNTSYYDATRALGIAGNFHIVAFDTATLNTHTNGNVLAETLMAYANFGTNGLADEVSYIQNYARVDETSASSTAHTLALGSTQAVALEDNGNAFSVNGTKLNMPYHIFQDDDTSALPFVDMDTVRSQSENNSAALESYSDANVTTSFADENNRTITLNDPDAFGVYNTTASVMDGYNDRPISLKGFSQGSDGSLIINIDCTGVSSFTMPDLKMFFLDGTEAQTDEKTAFTEGRVLLNFTNCENTDITLNITKASVLALGANVTLSQNFNGTVVAENVTVDAEGHRDDFVGEFPAHGTYDVDVDLNPTKALTGRTLTAGEFSFELKQGTTVLQTVSNTADGNIPFQVLSYTQADIGNTYNYTINEVIPATGETGVTYDTMVLSFSVTVSDGGNGVLLDTLVSMPEDTIFNNSYSATGTYDVDVDLNPTKALTGRTLTAGEFSFELKQGTTVLQTVSNTADGKIPFQALSYTQDDIGNTYNYTINEVIPRNG